MATSFQFLNGQIVETTTTTQYHDPQVLIQSLTDQKQNIADELANYTTVRLQGNHRSRNQNQWTQ